MTSDSSPAVAHGAVRRPPGVVVAGLATSMFLIVLDNAMVNLAGLAIREGLGLSAAELAAVVNSYLVVFAGLLLLGGRIGDVLGGRGVFLAGMLAYLTASAFCALATSGPLLIAGRVGQGVAAAAVVPSALSLVLTLHTSAAGRARAMGIWGAVAGAGSLLGVFLGGALTELWGWQAVFWTPVPLGLLSVLVVWRAVPSVPGRPGRFDAVGAVTVTVGISGIALGMVSAAESGWGAPATIAGLTVGVAAVVAFVVAEHRSTHPLAPLEVLGRRPVATAGVVMMMLGATLVSLFFFLPLYQQEVVGMSALATGLSQVPIAVMIMVGSVAAPLLAGRIGLGRALRVALGLLLAGLLWLVLSPAGDGFTVHLSASFVLIGGGLGLGIVTAITVAVRECADGESGLLSGLVNAAQQLGGAIGLAALVGVAVGAGTPGGIAYTTAFLGVAVFVLVALAVSLLPTADPPAADPRRARPSHRTEPR